MPGEITDSARNILNLIRDIRDINDHLVREKNDYLLNKKLGLLNKMNFECSRIYHKINVSGSDIVESQKQELKKTAPQRFILRKPAALQKKEELSMLKTQDQNAAVPNFNSIKFKSLTKDQKKRYIKEVNIDYEEIKEFIKLQKSKEKSAKTRLEKKDYVIYNPSSTGKIANKFMKKYADNLVTKYPNFFEPMFRNFKMVEMELLSRSYVSMMLFFTILSFPLIFLFFLALNFAFNLSIPLILLISFFGMIFTFTGFYFYPASLIGGKNKRIRLEYPFALVHMSAVAGSGAKPVSIFELIADSDDYPELKKEVKKIMNYVNLFGYNLTNALRNVASTTPNPEFKELLNGMISTIETGGDLKAYLKEKAEDALNDYRLDRKKQVEALATYSEIYTAILIASPLLLLVTLAIINSIGGGFGGFSVATIAWVGILGVLPLLNIGFMIFVSISQKGI